MAHIPRCLTALAAACLASSLYAGPAEAGTTCKSKTTLGDGFTEDQAVSSWRSQAKNSYGSGWSNFALAKDKKYYQQNMLAGELTTITAYPCRRT